MNQPVSWLEFITVISVFLLAEIVFALWQARGTFRELVSPKAGDEAAPDRQDGDSADPTRAGVQPAASSPRHTLPLDCRGEGHEHEEELPDCRTCWPLVQRYG